MLGDGRSQLNSHVPRSLPNRFIRPPSSLFGEGKQHVKSELLIVVWVGSVTATDENRQPAATRMNNSGQNPDPSIPVPLVSRTEMFLTPDPFDLSLVIHVPTRSMFDPRVNKSGKRSILKIFCAVVVLK